MKYSLLVLTLISLIACSKHNIEPELNLSSNASELHELLNDKNLTNTEKFQVYKKLHTSTWSKDFDQTLSYLNKEKELAEEMDDQKILADTYFNIGLLKLEHKDLINSTDAYLQSLKLYESLNLSEDVADVINNLGIVFLEGGNYIYAIDFFDTAIPVYKSKGKFQNLILSNYNKAICLYSMPDPQFLSSEEHFKQTLLLADQLPQDLKESYFHLIYYQMGAMFYKKGEYQQAINHYTESLKFLSNQPEKEFYIYANLSEVETALENYQMASTYMTAALDISEKIDIDKQILTGALNIQGKLFQAQGQHSEAIAIYEHAIEISNKDVINLPLQESLSQIRTSFDYLYASGKNLEASHLLNTLAYDDIQDHLLKDLEKKTNFNALNEALVRTIQLDEQKQQTAQEADYKLMFIIASVLLLLITVAFVYKWVRTDKDLKRLRGRLDVLREMVSLPLNG